MGLINKRLELYSDVYDLQLFSLCAGQLHQHIVNGVRVFALPDKRVFQVYEGFDNLRPFLLGQIDMILLFFHCPAPPDASIILWQLQKTQRCDYTIYILIATRLQPCRLKPCCCLCECHFSVRLKLSP